MGIDLEERLWDIVNAYINQHNEFSHQNFHDGALNWVAIGINEVLYVFKEAEESALKMLADAAHKVGSMLAHKGEVTEKEQEALDVLQNCFGRLYGHRTDRDSVMFSVDPGVRNKFETLCAIQQKEPSQLFAELVNAEKMKLGNGFSEEEGDC